MDSNFQDFCKASTPSTELKHTFKWTRFPCPLTTAPVMLAQLCQRHLGDQRFAVGQLETHHGPHLIPGPGLGDPCAE